jgi:valyl-tRNA synthetase
VVADENFPAEFAPVLEKMANLTAISHIAATQKEASWEAFMVKTTNYFIPLEGSKIDLDAERAKLQTELQYLEGFLASVMQKLDNERFVANAPAKAVENERAKKADAEAKIAALRERIAALK